MSWLMREFMEGSAPALYAWIRFFGPPLNLKRMSHLSVFLPGSVISMTVEWLAETLTVL